MAIVGGAVVPLAQGYSADRIGIHHAFFLASHLLPLHPCIMRWPALNQTASEFGQLDRTGLAMRTATARLLGPGRCS